jgi:hypothetical protein
MTLSTRDKRALILLGVAVVILYFFSGDDAPQVVGATVNSIPLAERQLARLREQAAAIPGKEQALAGVSAELAKRENGLIQADTAAQAQAQLLQIVRRIAREQENPIELKNTEIGQVKAFGDKYGEVALSVNFEAGIEQLINFLSHLTTQKELIGTTDIRIGTANPKQKTMPVRLTLTALVRKELIPEKKGAAF